MSEGRITELRLTAFKSFRNAVLPLEPMTILIGRNGSGKSNALEALGLLARLARGQDLRDAVEGDGRDVEPIRGGLHGCAPHGTRSFTLGVGAVVDDGSEVTLDLTVQLDGPLQIDHERLVVTMDGQPRTVLETFPSTKHPTMRYTKVWNAALGKTTRRQFHGRNLMTFQLAPLLDEIPGSERIAAVVAGFLGMLSGTLHLSPLPERMRHYVSGTDTALRGSASNVSAVIANLETTSPERFDRLRRAMGQLPEYAIEDLKVVPTMLGHVIVALDEHIGDSTQLVSARELSDGMLRTLAIATGLVAGGSDRPPASLTQSRETVQLLAIEELESGLHPSQASSLLGLVAHESARSDFQVLLTTHSPALLDALTGDQHRGVVVIQRDSSSGWSTATRLSDLPGYLRMMATSSLGSAVTRGRVAEAARPMPAADPQSIDEILGIG